MQQTIIFTEETFTAGRNRTIRRPEVWLTLRSAGNVNNCVALLTTCERSSGLCNSRKKIRDGNLLLLSDINVKVLTGDLRFLKININGLAKLLAFVDESHQTSDNSTRPRHWEVISDFNTAMLYDSRILIKWFLLQVIDDNTEYKSLLSLIRFNESYNIVRFLLKYSQGNKSLLSLGKKYGVSYSHFRRLCHQALGQSVKNDMCNWRMARTMLDVIDGKFDITEAALHNGYSSSSHFSNEVKNKFGLSPRTLHKFTRGFIKNDSQKVE